MIKAEEKLTVIFKEMKQVCLLQQKLFELKTLFPVYAKLCFNRLLELQPLRMRMSRI